MPNAIVRANARTMPDRASTATVFAADDASPAAYIALYERYGNIAYWDVGRDGREFFALYFPARIAGAADCGPLQIR